MSRYRYTIWTWRNLAVLPVVPIRIAVMAPLWALAGIGHAADAAFDAVSSFLPGIEKKRVPVKLRPGAVEPRPVPKDTAP